MRTNRTSTASFLPICFLILFITGCSSTTQDMFADTLGVSPDFEDTSDSNSTPEVVTAVNELAIKDPTARASLRREEVVPEEEKKKIVPPTILKTRSIPKAEQTSLSTGASDSVAPAKKITIEKNAPVAPVAPVKLNQLYFDNRDRPYWEGETVKDLVRLSRASYVKSDESPQVINPLTYSDSPEFVRIESLMAKANQKIGAGGMPTFIIPFALLVFVLIIAAAALGYNYELKRIRSAEKNELAKKNLWNKGLTELLPPR